jgi:hypothetical protein
LATVLTLREIFHYVYYSDENGLDLDQCRWTCKSSLDYFYFRVSTCWCGLDYSLQKNRQEDIYNIIIIDTNKHATVRVVLFPCGRHLLNVLRVGLICITNGAGYKCWI